MIRYAAFASALALAAGSAIAQERPTSDRDARSFEAIDLDGNEYISADEARETDDLMDQFARADSNGDQQLDQNEYEIAVELNQVTSPNSAAQPPVPPEEEGMQGSEDLAAQDEEFGQEQDIAARSPGARTERTTTFDRQAQYQQGGQQQQEQMQQQAEFQIPAPVTDQMIQDLQQALKDQGHDIRTDGVWGPETHQALQQYQQSQQGLEATGQINTETLASLNVGQLPQTAQSGQEQPEQQAQADQQQAEQQAQMDQEQSEQQAQTDLQQEQSEQQAQTDLQQEQPEQQAQTDLQQEQPEQQAQTDLQQEQPEQQAQAPAGAEEEIDQAQRDLQQAEQELDQQQG